MPTERQAPLWQNLPQELTQRPRWVLWREVNGSKVPFSPQGAKVSVTASSTGWSIGAVRAAFERGSFCGIGFVLTGDGIIGFDFDDCLEDEAIASIAAQLLEELGVAYVEVSPSGRGLRAFGICAQAAPLPGRRFEYRGVKMEVYANARYLTVTGRLYGRTAAGVALADTPAAARLLASKAVRNVVTNPTEEAEGTEDPEDDEASEEAEENEVSKARMAAGKFEHILSRIPAECLPTATGMRHDALFNLARFLKAEMPIASGGELLKVVKHWHANVYAVISTKDFGITWAEFLIAWNRVKFALGGQYLAGALERLPEKLPEWMQGHHFGASGDALLKICLALAELHGDEPFFLGCRKAGELLNLHPTSAALLLKALVDCGYIEHVRMQLGPRKSYRYRIGTSRKFAGYSA